MGKLAAYIWMAGIVFLCLMPAKAVMAKESEELPQIAEWENGNGLDASGSIIKDRWAYDTVNPAGRYVLFGEQGEVVRKKEAWEDTGEDCKNYTVTEQNPGKFGFRCQIFEGFAGTVTITMRAKSGRKLICTLSPETFFEANLDASSGFYTVESVAAQWEGCDYQVELPVDSFVIGEGQFVLVKITVTETVIKEIQETDESSSGETMEDKEKGQEEQIESEVKKDMTETGRRPFILLSAVLAAGIFGFMIYKKKRDRYA